MQNSQRKTQSKYLWKQKKNICAAGPALFSLLPLTLQRGQAGLGLSLKLVCPIPVLTDPSSPWQAQW